MSQKKPPPKKPRKKDADYMRKAYLYTGILLILGLIGGLLLADRIVTAEAGDRSAAVEVESEDRSDTSDAVNP